MAKLAIALLALVVLAPLALGASGGQTHELPSWEEVEPKIAFMANMPNQFENVYVTIPTTGGDIEVPLAPGHVAFGFQKDDGKFVFGSFGPINSLEEANIDNPVPYFGPGLIEVKILDNMDEVKKYLCAKGYTSYKIFLVDNPDQNAAWEFMTEHLNSNYNLLSSVRATFSLDDIERPSQSDDWNCLTMAIDVLEAYGVNNLPPVTHPYPNVYYLSIQSKILYPDFLDDESESQSSFAQFQSQNIGLPEVDNNWWNSITTWFATWKELSLNFDSLLSTAGVVLVLLIGIRLIWRNLGAFIVNGVLGLAVLYLSSTQLGIWVNINAMTLLVCAIGGIPGAVLLIVLQYFYGISF